jgi:hypothetical protein
VAGSVLRLTVLNTGMCKAINKSVPVPKQSIYIFNPNNFDKSFKLMFHKAKFNILHMKAESYYGTIVIMTSRHNFNLSCNSSSNLVYSGVHWLAI